MTVNDPQNAALVAHIVLQIEQNVEFLASQNYISQADSSAILSRLPNHEKSPSAISQLSSKFSRVINPSSASRAPAPAVPALQQARALWGYNEDCKDPDDLSFSPGDIIEIVEETNADWWTGRINGKQALFPATYVEKIQSPASVSQVTPTTGAKPYRPFGAAYHGMGAPPPPGQGINEVGLQEKPGTEEKKGKFGKYGNTMAHSAAGGVGFGAGAAIGGGLVRAIF